MGDARTQRELMGLRAEVAALRAELAKLPVRWSLAGGDRVFPVRVEKDGGTELGGWTYTVRTLDGATTLATAVTPQLGRMPVKYFYAGEGGRSDIGLAMRDGDELLLLIAFGETPKAGKCA